VAPLLEVKPSETT